MRDYPNLRALAVDDSLLAEANQGDLDMLRRSVLALTDAYEALTALHLFMCEPVPTDQGAIEMAYDLKKRELHKRVSDTEDAVLDLEREAKP